MPRLASPDRRNNDAKIVPADFCHQKGKAPARRLAGAGLAEHKSREDDVRV